MITPSQIPSPYIKPSWRASVGTMESILRYNCQNAGMPVPVGAWPMWEGAGARALDLSGHGNHGTLVGQPEWVVDGLDFNGSSNYIAVNDSNSLDVAGITVSCGINLFTTPAAAGYLLAKADDVGNQDSYRIWVSPSNKLSFMVSDDGSSSAQEETTDAIPLNTKIKVSFTYTSGAYNIYVNGNKVSSSNGDATGDIFSGYGRVTIGARYDLGESIYKLFLDGIIDNVQIFNTALSAAQVKFLYDNPYFMYRMPEELYGYVAAAGGGIDTPNKRRSAISLPWDIIYPVPDGNIGSRDRRHAAGFYQGLGGGTFEFSTAISAVTNTSSIIADVLRELTSTVSATTSLTQIELLITVLRELSTTIAATSTTSAAELKILREITTSVAAQTDSTAIVKVLREMTTAVTATTSLSQIELLIGILRELSTTISASTSTSAFELNVLREFTSAIGATTSSSAKIDILRELTSIISVTASLSQIELITAMLRELSTTVAATTATSTPEFNIARELSSAIAATTSTTATINALRELATTIAATASLSQIELLIGTLRELSTTVAATTSTSTSELNVLRELTSTLAAQSASGATINILRELTTTVAAGTSLSQIELLIGALRELTTTIAATTTTSTPSFNVLREFTSAIGASTATTAKIDVLRELTSAISAQTTLSQIELITAVLRELSTTIAATTSTSTSELKVLREIVASMDAQTASTASINVLRELESVVVAGTSLSQIELLIGALIELSTTIASTTSTSTINLDAGRALSTTISATTSTSDITILMVRALSAQIAAGTDVGAATMLVLREFSSSIDAETSTSAIDLIVRAAQIIIDTQITTLTPERMATPYTPKRLISST